MNRKETLLKSLDGIDKELIDQFVDEIVFLEQQLVELRKLPFISVNPKNSMQQRSTPAQKQYKEFFQQYTNALKILFRASGQDENDDESPLRKWVNSRVNSE